MAAASSHAQQGWLARLLAPRRDLSALYNAAVAEARRPVWYTDHGVPDTIDGRFDMVALVLSLVLLRLEREGDGGKRASVRLTEHFIDDMDGEMREIGFGDLVVGKKVGGMMSALGGRLGAYREGVTDAALVRNLWRGEPPPEDIRKRTLAEVEALARAVDTVPVARLIGGAIR